ncbi:MAG: UDP-3-O-(3-hydroxymyristoyl)glucosamine N-acyltransferase [Leptospiraceae bacterium]|nr:UDP-3-O-(3-hydroxymyristoyl)glucosamine N-acyltransferase [Leptospiraceae bacterium]
MVLFTLAELQKLIPDSEVRNSEKPDEIKFQSIGSLDSSNTDFISFIANKTNLKDAKKSKALGLITNSELASEFTIPVLVVPNVDLGLIAILNYLFPPNKPDGIISKTAIIHPTAKIGEGSTIGDYVTIGANSSVGKNSILEDGVKIATNVKIGDNARIGMNCVFHKDTQIGNNFIVFGNSTFGGDGFRFSTIKGIHHKIPQVGRVIIGDDVEIGSNCAVDRGGLEDTVIGNGCKFDNMVHIGHNVKIGNNVIIAGQSGVAGSTTIGNDVLIAGACAISDHLELMDGTVVAGGTGLRTSPKEKNVYIGWDWGMTFAEFQKARVNIKHLIGFNKWASRIKTLEKKLGIVAEE